MTFLLSVLLAVFLIGGFNLELQAKPGKGKKSHGHHGHHGHHAHKKEKKHYKKHKGPPAHAPAHGHRRTKYVYHEEQRVVYFPDAKTYAWERIIGGVPTIKYGTSLPSSIKLGPGVSGTKDFKANEAGDGVNFSLVKLDLF